MKVNKVAFFEVRRVHFSEVSMKKVYLETYGCQMNVSDSERVATSLVSKGFEMTTDEHSADIILLNTCSVREKAEQKLYSRVGRVRSTYEKKPMKTFTTLHFSLS